MTQYTLESEPNRTQFITEGKISIFKGENLVGLRVFTGISYWSIYIQLVRQPGFAPGFTDWKSDVLDETGRLSLYYCQPNMWEICQIKRLIRLNST